MGVLITKAIFIVIGLMTAQWANAQSFFNTPMPRGFECDYPPMSLNDEQQNSWNATVFESLLTIVYWAKQNNLRWVDGADAKGFCSLMGEDQLLLVDSANNRLTFYFKSQKLGYAPASYGFKGEQVCYDSILRQLYRPGFSGWCD